MENKVKGTGYDVGNDESKKQPRLDQKLGCFFN